MKILVMSDEESVLIWDKYKPALLTEADLVISAGDLKPEYLSYAVTYAHGPVLYVHGNHDEGNAREPEGCVCIDDRLYEYRGVRIRGLGGTDFRPVFSYVDKLIEQREFQNLKGLIYFTDGFGSFPAQKPAYESAFVFLQEEINNPDVPPWAIKLVLKKEEI